jgi:hypothetical protein
MKFLTLESELFRSLVARENKGLLIGICDSERNLRGHARDERAD